MDMQLNRILLIAISLILMACLPISQQLSPEPPPSLDQDVMIRSATEELQTILGAEHSQRIETGVRQTAAMWRPEDGSESDFIDFCKENFISDPVELDAAFARLEVFFETLYGVLTEFGRTNTWHLDVVTGPIYNIDHVMARFDLGRHVNDDLWKDKLAFYIILNWKQYGLNELESQGSSWSRREWAEARLARGFDVRIPAEVTKSWRETLLETGDYIDNYNIIMSNLRDENGVQLFPDNLRLISHWGLRDELRGQYDREDGYSRQVMIYRVMTRIIDQSIPAAVIDNPEVLWNPYDNTMDGNVSPAEPDSRYEHLSRLYQTTSAMDQFYPGKPDAVARRYERSREISEERVQTMFRNVLGSEEFKATGEIIRQRLGRDLQPWDIWYTGFRSRSEQNESELDRITTEKYPSAEAFHAGMPGLLMALGFDEETAAFLQSKIEVDASRGVGHAAGAERRSDNAHLRTRVENDGMRYKGYNIAVHELGHNVEQVFSLNRMDYYMLRGVPATAFTEAMAFLFQSKNLEILDLTREPDAGDENFRILGELWSLGEIAAVGLVDTEVWHWMYEHPEATPAELKAATIQIAQEIWNTYYAPIMGIEDSPILAIYSHMISYPLYLPSYGIGHIINFQLESWMQDKNLAEEMERMCRIGSVTPDEWMRQAVGQPLSEEPLLKAAEEALAQLGTP